MTTTNTQGAANLLTELQLADAYAKAHAMYCMEDLYGSSKSYTEELLKARHDARGRLASALASAAAPSKQETEATHLRELAAYRLTVENLEREIAAQQPAPSPAPAGWKLVPVEPTEGMLKAADDGDDAYTLRCFGPGVQRVMQGPYDHYCAMLDAAPTAQQPQQGVAYAALPDAPLPAPHFGEGRYLGLAFRSDAYSVAQVQALFASHGQAPAQPDHAYSEACNLATALFKKHFAHQPDYASGQVVWGLCDSTAGVISQIDNMVSGLVQPPTTSPQAAQQAPAEASPTAGMNIPQRILHVGGRNNDAGYVEFGSIQAVEALVRQVLRDLPALAQADSVLEDAARLKEAVGLLEELAEHDSYSTEYDGRMISLCPECGEQEGEHRPNCAFVRAKTFLAARKQGGAT